MRTFTHERNIAALSKEIFSEEVAKNMAPIIKPANERVPDKLRAVVINA